MRMGSSRAAQAARTRLAGAALRFLCAIAAAGRSESRKLLRQPSRAAMWTLSAFPFPGSNQEFAVPFAFLAMKFVNRHGEKVTAFQKSSSLFDPDFLIHDGVPWPGHPVSPGWIGKSSFRP